MQEKSSASATAVALALLAGWILGQAGLVGLALAGICLGVTAHMRGYRIVIENRSRNQNGEE